MHFKNFYQTKSPVFSFELFPPKNQKQKQSFLNEVAALARLKPTFFSVTYGAMGSTRDLTGDLALFIHKNLHIPAAFHFTCVGSNKEQIFNFVEHLKKQGLNLIVSLRGDPPKGQTKFTAQKDGFQYANELVSYLKEIGGFSQAVAGYPEGHLEAKDLKSDLEYLKQKVDCGAEVILTQLFYDNARFYDFIDRAQKIGIDVPIVPGIMPLTRLAQIDKIAHMAGAYIPQKLKKQVEKFRDQPAEFYQMGIDFTIDQCHDLLQNKVPGIHFYTLNKAAPMEAIFKELADSQI